MDILVTPAPLPQLDSEQVQRRLANCQRLPSLSSVNSIMRELLDAEQCYISQVADVVRRDPGLTTRLLRMVNSVYYGLSAPVGSIEEAVFYLGVHQIRRLAVLTPVIEDLQKLAGSTRFPWRDFWRHCIATAVLTHQSLGDVQSHPDESDYVAGLLHDVGKLIIAAAFPEYFEQIHARLREPGADLLDVEREVLGHDHCSLGARYLSFHNLPEATIQAVRFHHAPLSATSEARLVAAVHLSDLLVRRAGIGDSGNPAAVSEKDWTAAASWNVLYPRAPHEQAIARANMERGLDRLSLSIEGLV